MVTAKLYIEGGGDSREQSIRFREAWNDFFASAGVGARTQIVRGGGRKQTFDRFVTATKRKAPSVVPLLLVDSEEAVAGRSVWQHLLSRDSWNKPVGARDDQAFLMVQTMETWFLADVGALRRYFGAQFRTNALKQWHRLEDVSKVTVMEALRRATAACAKPYAKGRISFELLATVDPAPVEGACPHAKALLDRLRAL